jgi:class 3 adenylate cyclase
MICPRCGAQIKDPRKFCGDCGSPLPWQCSSCGSENAPDKRFCGECGAASETKPRTPQQSPTSVSLPERRQLTVMFADMVGSTALGARLDPEDLRTVIASYHGTVKGLAARFEGFVASYMGDGVLIYFGYPQAHEDDAERAIRAGLTIVEAVPQMNTIAGPPGTLRTRIGIASGLVVVGDLIGLGASLESAAVGDPLNLAARLQTVAEPGAVVISEATWRLTGDLFEYRELPLAQLKGRQAPERMFQVLRESTIESRFEALHRDQISLVDRTEELELLLRRWDQAKMGEGRVVLVGGEPGIGKSRLIAALEDLIASTPHKRLRFVCSPHHRDTPLHPVIRHLERASGFQRTDTPAAKWQKLMTQLGLGPDTEEVALMADLLGIPNPGKELVDRMVPQRRKAMTLDTMVRWIEALARQTPVLGIFEDLHWADPSTLELLEFSMRALAQLPIMLVITARSDVKPAWVSRSYVTVLFLSQLDRERAISLVRQVAGARELPDSVVDRIVAHADGIPLFLEELTKTVLQRQEPEAEGPLPLESLSADVVPISLYASLMARLDRLPIGKEAAQIGAVIGREFSFESLAALSQIAPQRLEHALEELAGAGIILVHGKPPRANYSFKHALVQDAAYASLLRDRRRAIHLRLAETLEHDGTEPQLVAWHFAEGGEPDKSSTYYLKAAELATGRYALAEIVGHLRNGLRQIAQLAESRDKQHRELVLQVALGRALIDHQGSGSEAVRETFEHARELCLALDEVQVLPRIYDGLMLNYHFTHSQPQKMLDYAREMIAVHQRTNDRQALLMARRAGGLANLLLGRFTNAREEMQVVIDMYDPEHDRPYVGMSTRDPKVSICTLQGTCLTILGYPQSGAAMSLAGVTHAETLDHPISLILGLRRACLQAMVERNAERVAQLADRLLGVGGTYETFKGGLEGAIFHDWAALRRRPDQTAKERIQASLRKFDSVKNWALLPFYMASAAQLFGEHGDLETATSLLQRAAELVGVTGERWCEPEILRLQGCLGDYDEALLRQSLAQAKEQGARLWELRTATSLAELWREHGNPSAARELLTPIYESFPEKGSAADVVAARDLLDAL